MTLRVAKCAWFFAWAVLCLATLPSGVVEVRHLVGVAAIGLLVYVARDRIFKHRARSQPVSYPRASLVVACIVALGAWAGFGLTLYNEGLSAYRLSTLVAALGLTGFLVLDCISSTTRHRNL